MMARMAHFAGMRGSALSATVGFLLFGIVAYVIWGLFASGGSEGEMEAAMAPAIEALDKYKAANGRYPDRVDALVPGLLAAAPLCPDGKKPIYFLDKNEFVIGCAVMMFDRRLYDSGAKKWKALD